MVKYIKDQIRKLKFTIQYNKEDNTRNEKKCEIKFLSFYLYSYETLKNIFNI